jgi:hypothetical protein
MAPRGSTIPRRNGSALQTNRARPKILARTSRPKKSRMTLNVESLVDQNLEAYCLQNGFLKTEIVNQALKEFLAKKHYQTDKPPKISVTW